MDTRRGQDDGVGKTQSALRSKPNRVFRNRAIDFHQADYIGGRLLVQLAAAETRIDEGAEADPRWYPACRRQYRERDE